MASRTYIQCPGCKQSVHRDEFIGIKDKRLCLRCVENKNNWLRDKKPRPKRATYHKSRDQKVKELKASEVRALLKRPDVQYMRVG